MRVARYLFGTAIVVLLTIASGCKPREEPAPSTSAVVSPDAAAAREALTRGMTEVAFTSLSQGNIGESCVVVARTPEGARREPPPSSSRHGIPDGPDDRLQGRDPWYLARKR